MTEGKSKEEAEALHEKNRRVEFNIIEQDITKKKIEQDASGKEKVLEEKTISEKKVDETPPPPEKKEDDKKDEKKKDSRRRTRRERRTPSKRPRRRYGESIMGTTFIKLSLFALARRRHRLRVPRAQPRGLSGRDPSTSRHQGRRTSRPATTAR